MSKQELSEHAGGLPCSKGNRLWRRDLPSSQDKQQIKDDAVLIEHHKYGGESSSWFKWPRATQGGYSRVNVCSFLSPHYQIN